MIRGRMITIMILDVYENAFFPIKKKVSVALHLLKWYFNEGGFCIYSKGMACMGLGFYKSSWKGNGKGEEEI